jgi:hypothetical protein
MTEHDEEDNNTVVRKWRIYRSSNMEGSKSSGVHNPRDGTIDSSSTEEIIGMRFTDMRDAIPLIVAPFIKEDFMSSTNMSNK